MPLSQQGKTQVPSGKVNLNDIAIFYKVFSTPSTIAGVAKPTLIFIHGGPGIVDHNMYVPFWSQLEDVADIHFLDLRGNGESGAKELIYQDTWRLQQWADDIVAYCAARNITRPIIAGVSLWNTAFLYFQKTLIHPLNLPLAKRLISHFGSILTGWNIISLIIALL